MSKRDLLKKSLKKSTKPLPLRRLTMADFNLPKNFTDDRAKSLLESIGLDSIDLNELIDMDKDDFTKLKKSLDKQQLFDQAKYLVRIRMHARKKCEERKHITKPKEVDLTGVIQEDLEEELRKIDCPLSLEEIVELTTSDFTKFKGDYEEARREVLTRVRRLAQQRIRLAQQKRRISEMGALSISKRLSQQIPTPTVDTPKRKSIAVSDLDTLLQEVGIQETAEDIMTMNSNAYDAYRTYSGFSARQLKVLKNVRYRIRQRLRYRGQQASISSSSNFGNRLRCAGIKISVDFIRTMSEQSFSDYMDANKWNKNQKKLLTSVWSAIQAEKAMHEEVQRILDDNQLHRFTVHRVKKIRRGDYLDFMSKSHKILTSLQKDALKKCTKLLRPKFYEECEIMLDALNGDSDGQETLYEDYLGVQERMSIISLDSDECLYRGHLDESDDVEPNRQNSSNFFGYFKKNLGAASLPEDNPGTSFDEKTRVRIQDLDDGSKIFAKKSTMYPGHVFTYRLRNMPTESNSSSDSIEIYECSSCIYVSSTYKSFEARKYVMDTLKTVKVRDGEIIEGDYDGLGHVCVPIELIKKKYNLD